MRADRVINGDKQPVADWFDEEMAAALRTCQKLRTIGKPSQETDLLIKAARYRYEKMKVEKTETLEYYVNASIPKDQINIYCHS